MKATFDITAGLLGDACLAEPALNAYGLRHGGSVNVYIKNEDVHPLYANHPVIRIVDKPSGNRLDESRAFSWAVDNRRYFAEGYWPQVGLTIAPDDRRHFRMFSSGDPSRLGVTNEVILCPFSRSCASHAGEPANKTVPVAWWEDVIGRIKALPEANGLKFVSLGSGTDPNVEGMIPYHGLPLRAAVDRILRARLLITVETWANIVAGDKTLGRTLFMSAATPEWFIAPPKAAIVRSQDPARWSKDGTVQAARLLLASASGAGWASGLPGLNPAATKAVQADV